MIIVMSLLGFLAIVKLCEHLFPIKAALKKTDEAALYASGALDPFGHYRETRNAKQADQMTGLLVGGEL